MCNKTQTVVSANHSEATHPLTNEREDRFGRSNREVWVQSVLERVTEDKTDTDTNGQRRQRTTKWRQKGL